MVLVTDYAINMILYIFIKNISNDLSFDTYSPFGVFPYVYSKYISIGPQSGSVISSNMHYHHHFKWILLVRKHKR